MEDVSVVVELMAGDPVSDSDKAWKTRSEFSRIKYLPLKIVFLILKINDDFFTRIAEELVRNKKIVGLP